MASLLVLQAAVDRGLGAWCFGVAQGELELRQSLHVPAALSFVGVIGLGYRADSETVVVHRAADVAQALHRLAGH